MHVNRYDINTHQTLFYKESIIEWIKGFHSILKPPHKSFSYGIKAKSTTTTVFCGRADYMFGIHLPDDVSSNILREKNRIFTSHPLQVTFSINILIFVYCWDLFCPFSKILLHNARPFPMFAKLNNILFYYIMRETFGMILLLRNIHLW